MPDRSRETAGYPASNRSIWIVPEAISCASMASAEVVLKAWGEERLLVNETAPWGFKFIRIGEGMRTSLHFHEAKEEAFLILSGKATLYAAANRHSQPQAFLLSPGNVVHIRPGSVHRLQAITDVTLVEVSTPELLDVIRISEGGLTPERSPEAGAE